MNVKGILSRVAQLARSKGISEPYIVGGLPRDKVLGKITNIDDIDLTTGDESVHELAKLVAEAFRRTNPGLTFKQLPDGHSQVNLGQIKLDFSSNYNSPQVSGLLSKAGITDPNSLQREMFSRDFTCNTLLATMSLDRIMDPTTMGLADIRKKILRTPLPPHVTLANDPKRVVRVVYMAAKLGFDVEPDIIRWVRAHPAAVGVSSEKSVRDKLTQATQYDPARTVKLMTQMGLWNQVQIPKALMPYAARRSV
jgi:tRNA nucleotidyltransferase/poly(A) polymerase